MTNKYVGHCELFCICNELNFGAYISHINLAHFLQAQLQFQRSQCKKKLPWGKFLPVCKIIVVQ